METVGKLGLTFNVTVTGTGSARARQKKATGGLIAHVHVYFREFGYYINDILLRFLKKTHLFLSAFLNYNL